REGINPMAACLPMFLQFPVLFAMYAALRRFTPIPLDDLKKLGAYVKLHGGSLVHAAKTLKIRAPQDKLEAIGTYVVHHHTSVTNAALHRHTVQRMPFLGLAA